MIQLGQVIILLVPVLVTSTDQANNKNTTRIARNSGKDPLLELMLRALAVPRQNAGEQRTSNKRNRMDPLLRQLMITALERSQDERDRDNLTPPKLRQDPLLRQLRLSLTTSQDQL